MTTQCEPVMKPWYLTQAPVDLDVPQDPILLLKVDNWILEKISESSKYSDVYHYCTAMQWKTYTAQHVVLKEGYCLECHEDIPEPIVAAFMMHNWSYLQGSEPLIPIPTSYLFTSDECPDGPPIRIFR